MDGRTDGPGFCRIARKTIQWALAPEEKRLISDQQHWDLATPCNRRDGRTAHQTIPPLASLPRSGLYVSFSYALLRSLSGLELGRSGICSSSPTTMISHSGNVITPLERSLSTLTLGGGLLLCTLIHQSWAELHKPLLLAAPMSDAFDSLYVFLQWQ